MPLSMYQASVPVFLQLLGSHSKILQKAAAHAEARKIDPNALLSARLYPDMFPLTRQVQTAADHAKGAVARLAGADVPSFPDTEASFAELEARLQKTSDFIKTFKPEQIDGSEEREIVLHMRAQSRTFTGQTYLLHFALPNFYFHMTTAYAILRHNGVEIGKRDFLIAE
jgi:uncharacterized protein